MASSLDHLTELERKVVLSFSQELKKVFRENLIEILLFGSKARGNFNEESDIDIFVLLKEKNLVIEDKISDILVNYQLKYDLRLSPVVFSQIEFEKNKELASPIIEHLERDGIKI